MGSHCCQGRGISRVGRVGEGVSKCRPSLALVPGLLDDPVQRTEIEVRVPEQLDPVAQRLTGQGKNSLYRHVVVEMLPNSARGNQTSNSAVPAIVRVPGR